MPILRPKSKVRKLRIKDLSVYGAYKIQSFSTGKPKREIMHVDDLSSAIFFIINKKISNDKRLLSYLKKNSMINVGSGSEYSIKQFATKMIQIINGKSKLKFNTKFPDGTLRKILDTKSTCTSYCSVVRSRFCFFVFQRDH